MHLDLLVLSDSGNIHDALFLAAAAVLRDARVPRTRSVVYSARRNEGSTVDRLATEDTPMGDAGQTSGLDTRSARKATDFELEDYWDEGEPLKCEASWPLCVTLNLVGPFSLTLACCADSEVGQVPPIHYLDATPMEETATSLRLLLLFSFSDSGARLQGTRLFGPGEVNASSLKPLLRVSIYIS